MPLFLISTYWHFLWKLISSLTNQINENLLCFSDLRTLSARHTKISLNDLFKSTRKTRPTDTSPWIRTKNAHHGGTDCLDYTTSYQLQLKLEKLRERIGQPVDATWRRAAERMREAEGLSSSPRLAEMFFFRLLPPATIIVCSSSEFSQGF